jgi:hypothetical protein
MHFSCKHSLFKEKWSTRKSYCFTSFSSWKIMWQIWICYPQPKSLFKAWIRSCHFPAQKLEVPFHHTLQTIPVPLYGESLGAPPLCYTGGSEVLVYTSFLQGQNQRLWVGPLVDISTKSPLKWARMRTTPWCRASWRNPLHSIWHLCGILVILEYQFQWKNCVRDVA